MRTNPVSSNEKLYVAFNTHHEYYKVGTKDEITDDMEAFIEDDGFITFDDLSEQTEIYEVVNEVKKVTKIVTYNW